jgi:heme exporter protein D
MENAFDWVNIVLGILGTLLIPYIVYSIKSRKKYRQDVHDELDKKANMEYVDKLIGEVKCEIKENTKNESSKYEALLLLVKSIDRKLEILIVNKRRKNGTD